MNETTPFYTNYLIFSILTAFTLIWAIVRRLLAHGQRVPLLVCLGFTPLAFDGADTVQRTRQNG